MRRLLLLRHSKAEGARPGGRDPERKLAERGRADATRIGAYLVRHGFAPDRAVVSPAVRTRETCALVCAAFATRPPTELEDRLYDAAPETILELVQETASQIGTLLVIGHNPGLHMLATLLIASGDLDARQQLNEGLPTSGLVVIEFAADDWRRVHPHGGRLERFVTPRLLAASAD